MTTALISEPKAHPFELAGMGVGPYRFLCIVQMPNLSGDSAANFGNANPYAEVQAMKMKEGAGTCACCGMGITVICVVEDGSGDRWGVGSDCIEKADEPALCDAAQVAIAKRRNRMSRERAEVKRQERQCQWEAAPSKDTRATAGETNAQFNVRRTREAQEETDRSNAELANKGEVLKPMASAMRDGQGGFCDSIANDLARGIVPTGRGLSITLDILAKRAGRRNSAAYDAELNRVSDIFASL